MHSAIKVALCWLRSETIPKAKKAMLRAAEVQLAILLFGCSWTCLETSFALADGWSHINQFKHTAPMTIYCMAWVWRYMEASKDTSITKAACQQCTLQEDKS